MSTGDHPADVELYEVEVLATISALIASMLRGGQLLDAYPEYVPDAVWRAEACTEFRSWRTHLAALPVEAPPRYHEVHARLLRWAQALAAVGDAYAAAIAAQSLSQIAAAQRGMQDIPGLYQAMQEAVIRIAEATEDPGDESPVM